MVYNGGILCLESFTLRGKSQRKTNLFEYIRLEGLREKQYWNYAGDIQYIVVDDVEMRNK